MCHCVLYIHLSFYNYIYVFTITNCVIHTIIHTLTTCDTIQYTTHLQYNKVTHGCDNLARLEVDHPEDFNLLERRNAFLNLCRLAFLRAIDDGIAENMVSKREYV